MKKISVIMPSFNQAKYIEKAIKSVIDQNYEELEFIIIDGGSTDGSVDIIKKHEKNITYWVSEKDKGQSDAINKGFSKASGEIFAWLNSDDYYAPDALEFVGNYNWGESTGLLVGIGQKVNESGQVVYKPLPYKNYNFNGLLTEQRHLSQPACFFTKEAWEEVGPLNESLNYCMDAELWLKIAKKFQIENVDKELAYATQQPDAKTVKHFYYAQVELSLMLTTFGGFDSAKVRLTEQIESLLIYKKKFALLEKNIIYKTLRKWLKKR